MLIAQWEMEVSPTNEISLALANEDKQKSHLTKTYQTEKERRNNCIF